MRAKKTEPNYFNGIRDYYGLNTANVAVYGGSGSDPMSIVTYAKQRYREEKDAGDPFDKVYCVFDKDAHAHYERALNAIQSATPQQTYYAITSVPSFEYWLLLHFTPSTRPYRNLPGNSAGNQVLSELKNYMPDYQKGQQTVFTALLDQLEFAKNNALRSQQAAKANNTDNPSPQVHELVSFMQQIKST